jgi:hypothetical protein
MLLVQLVRLMRRFRARRWTGFAFVGLLLSVSIIGNAVTFHTFDGAVTPGLSWGDAFWYSFIRVGEGWTQGYTSLARALLDHGVTVLSVRRGATAHTRLANLSPQPGDTVVYVGETRRSWPELLALANRPALAAAS